MFMNNKSDLLHLKRSFNCGLIFYSCIFPTSLMAEHARELKEMESQVEDVDKELTDKNTQLELVEGELEDAKDANARAPTTTMKNLVERLRNQLALKEKQQQVSTV